MLIIRLKQNQLLNINNLQLLYTNNLTPLRKLANWITILTFTYPHESHLAVSLLESEGIKVFIKDELTTLVHNFYSNAIGGVKVQVMQEDYKNAYKLLLEADYIKDKKDELEIVKHSQTTDLTTCPFCNSKNIAVKKEANGLTAFVYSVLSIFSQSFKHGYMCFDCDKIWKYNY